MVLHRFASKASLDGWTGAPVGAAAITTDTGIEYRRIAGGWARITPWWGAAFGVANYYVYGGTWPIATLNVPADPGPRIAQVSCVLRVDKFQPHPATFVNIMCGATNIAQTDIPPEQDTTPIAGNFHQYYVTMSALMQVPTAGMAIVLQVAFTGSGGQYVMIQGAVPQTRLDAVVLPSRLG